MHCTSQRRTTRQCGAACMSATSSPQPLSPRGDMCTYASQHPSSVTVFFPIAVNCGPTLMMVRIKETFAAWINNQVRSLPLSYPTTCVIPCRQPIAPKPWIVGCWTAMITKLFGNKKTRDIKLRKPRKSMLVRYLQDSELETFILDTRRK